MSRRQIIRLERGDSTNPEQRTLRALAGALGVTPGELLDLIEGGNA